MDSLQEKVEQMSKLESELQKQAYEILIEFAASIFKVNPDIESFGWYQYTPSWNDGEPCYMYFCADMCEISINGVCLDDFEAELEDELEDEEDAERLYNEKKKEINDVAREISKFLTALYDAMPDFFERKFGSNQRVWITRDLTVHDEWYERY